MKIVVLDALPFNPGDLDWSPLASCGDLVLHDQTSPEQYQDRLADAEIVYTNKVRLGPDAFTLAPALKFVSVLATGYEIIDLTAARERGIVVSNVPGYSTASTAQTAIALLLELAYHVGDHDAAVRNGDWTRAGIWSFWNHPLVELDGKTLVVVGLGSIGSRVAQIAEALGMKIIAAELSGRSSSSSRYTRRPLDEALALADVVTLHCPLTPNTRALINAERLRLFKSSAFLINTARGPLVDDQAVADALKENRLAGFAADVLSVEPPSAENPLITAPNAIITPHLAWASRESRQRLMDTSIANLKAYLAGTPQNVIS